ncbi:hypothetical protein CTI12_AA121810 [Artemisia annua]|uniref:B3 domain-containing protein n=1 Tax=Artemisia annua TaxID=35608 RepID=A0A2U1PRS9_ARTAN|nr:hypothetical protein CTI12_AA121810 [Artemisia annua]
MELVNAARSFSLYLMAEDNDSFIKSSSSEKSSLAINKILTVLLKVDYYYLRLTAPQDIYPTYKDVLATQVNGPMKKRKKRPKRIKFGEVAAEQLNEPNNTAFLHPGEVPKHQPDVGFPVNDGQSVSVQLSLGLSVSGSTSLITEKSPSPMMKRLSPSKRMELDNAARSFSLYLTAEDNDSFIKSSSSEKSSLAINKRLNLPFKQLETKDFLTDEEKNDLKSGKEIVVQLLGPTLRMYDEPMKLKIWRMSSGKNYVLMNNWNNFVEENKDYLKHLSTIQLWSFRVDQQLCFALAVVERPMANGVNEVA